MNKPLLAAALAVLIVGAAGATTYVIRQDPPALTADQVKQAIGERYQASPDTFSVSEASAELALSRLEGFAVCAPGVEATSAQYVEVASFLDRKKNQRALLRVVDSVMKQKEGMSDCDFRVIEVLSRA